MKWIFAIEAENDLIVICRLMNALRRKALAPSSFAMSRSAEQYAVTLMAELPESEVEHYFNFFRRTEGVQHVTYYRHNPEPPASFIYVDMEAPALELSRWAQLFPGSRLVFASHGKALLEVPADFSADRPLEHNVTPFAQVRTTHGAPSGPQPRSGQASGIAGTIQ
ncbi:MAG: hypothetical protein ACRD10_10015 [Terriglobia bacterium]